MTSFNQRIANRTNAAKSTGPTTAEGKQVSAQNALSHGLMAGHVLMDGEDEEIYTALRLTLFEELAPDTMVEMQIVDRFFHLVWRSRRVPVFEAAILAWMGHWSGEYYDLDQMHKGWNQKNERIQKFHKGLRNADKERPEETNTKLLLGRLLHEEMSHNLIAKLSRYENHLLSQIRRTHKELLDEQERRDRRSPDFMPEINDRLSREYGEFADAQKRLAKSRKPRGEPRIWRP